MYEHLTVLALFALVFSAVAGRLAGTPITGPIVFLLFGWLAGPEGLGFLNLGDDPVGLRRITEVTLALILFIDAAGANLGVLEQTVDIPRRMLLFGLPLTILLGFGAAYMLFGGLPWIELALLATMLAPTDAALGKAVVSNEAVPASIRESLNAESGLNDGICVPILYLFLALAARGNAETDTVGLSLTLFAQELGIGLAVGVGVSTAGGWLLAQCDRRGWVTETWRQIPIVALALACFGLAQALHGSGFVAAFVGGLVFAYFARRERRATHPLLHSAEGISELLALVTWVVFGAVVVGQSTVPFTWEVVAYAVLSLTVIRMLPVWLSLTGMGLGTDTRLFLGWFGPRGLASIVFGVIVLQAELPGGERLAQVVVCTVILSVFLHGLTASPLARAYGARVAGRSRQA